MSHAIVAAENIGKQYRVPRGTTAEPYTALRDVLVSRIAHCLKRRRTTRRDDERFWALRNVDFTLDEGDVLGIIGPNGAGKSTLLKVLSGITEASEGQITLRGRLASLLEVGTGFHPELTGRENIFLNGAILGMTRREIRRKFDEIVTFASVERFLDMPVKRYSSGMHMRLAFAVAAHLDSEILVVDETLAVGDAQFQRKCLGRMSEIAADGRTVLFVSHNMNAIERLCTKAMHLDHGRLRSCTDDVRGTVSRYLDEQSTAAAASVWLNERNEIDHQVIQPLYLAVEDGRGAPLPTAARNDDTLFVVIRANIRQLDPALCIGFTLFRDSQVLFTSLNTDVREEQWPRLERGVVQLRCELPRRFLNEGTYRIELHCSLHNREWLARPGYGAPSVQFEIRGGLSDSPYWLQARDGLLAPEWAWSCEQPCNVPLAPQL